MIAELSDPLDDGLGNTKNSNSNVIITLYCNSNNSSNNDYGRSKSNISSTRSATIRNTIAKRRAPRGRRSRRRCGTPSARRIDVIVSYIIIIYCMFVIICICIAYLLSLLSVVVIVVVVVAGRLRRGGPAG